MGLIDQLISFSFICSIAGCARFGVDTAWTEINRLVVCDAVLFGREVSACQRIVQVLLCAKLHGVTFCKTIVAITCRSAC